MDYCEASPPISMLQNLIQRKYFNHSKNPLLLEMKKTEEKEIKINM